MTYRIITDKAEAEQCLRDGGVLREGEELKYKWRLGAGGSLWLHEDGVEDADEVSFSHRWWSADTPGPFVVVREPPPKPLTDEQIVAELERYATDSEAPMSGSDVTPQCHAYHRGLAHAYRYAARLVKERKL